MLLDETICVEHTNCSIDLKQCAKGEKIALFAVSMSFTCE